MLLNVVRRASSLFNLLFPIALIAIVGWFAYLKLDLTSAAAPRANSAPLIAISDAVEQSKPVKTAAPPVTKPAERTGDNSIISVGDTLQLAFYERLINEDDKWAAKSFSNRPAVSFQQRTELTGDYDVREDGVVVVPLLGAFQVAGRSVAQFEADAKTAFEQLIGRFAFMSVTVNRRPVYIVGPVKKPGYYKYKDGMTVLHVIAMAGGYDNPAVDLGNILQAVHEAEQKQKAGDRLKRLWAKLDVLTAERDATEVSASRELLQLCSPSEAKELLATEASLRALAVRNREAQAKALASSIQSTRNELQSQIERQDQVQSGVSARLARVDNLASLGDKIGRPIRAAAEAELSDTRARVHESSIAIHETESKLAQLEKEQQTLENQTKIELQQQIAELRSQVAEASSTTSASSSALDAMRTALIVDSEGSGGNTQFQIVRGTRSNRQTLTVPGTESINPGDLVRVVVTSEFKQPM
ncbi:polysaccharide biosynthesis/export family protein [Hyphomicrobium sp.]|uniref:polysaccharide biosynthesis/export family protein n=1 Tax=Hyphomicrobium sp. TaxID=82 RepID=UPI002D7A10A2|nr:SLBB domain-containing protein [Hyphomicrobium sp.]HET6391053.1 SLBB domain-containing protein [Hyphomicrobium sp.]